MSDYRLDDRGSLPCRGKGFSSNLCDKTRSEAHSASNLMGIGDSFPRGKVRPGRVAKLLLHLLPMPKMSRSYTSFPLSPWMASNMTVLFYFYRSTVCRRGGQVEQLQEPRFRMQQLARAMSQSCALIAIFSTTYFFESLCLMLKVFR
jgi:hypothetical protein